MRDQKPDDDWGLDKFLQHWGTLLRLAIILVIAVVRSQVHQLYSRFLSFGAGGNRGRPGPEYYNTWDRLVSSQ
jgi:hypothetical protein